MNLMVIMNDEFAEEVVSRKTRVVNKIPNIGEKVMVLEDGVKHIGIVDEVCNSYIDEKYIDCANLEYYTITCTQILKFKYNE